MGNVLRVLKRDLLRLLKAPSALIVMIALLVLPSAYTWYNVAAFWNPYGNTGNMQVSVVNQDAGATLDAVGSITVGDKVVDKLGENKKLGWKIEDYDAAMEHLNSGESVAVFVIPEDFTSDIVTIISGDFQQPTIEYYVNEKTGPVAAKVTDTGKTIMEETINSTFVKTISEVVVEVVDEALVESKDTVSQAKDNAVVKLSNAIDELREARATLSALDARLALLQSSHGSTINAINSLERELGTISGALENISAESALLQKVIDDTTPAVYESLSVALAIMSELIPYADEAGCGEELRAAINSLETYNQILFEQLLPASSRGLAGLSSATGGLSVVISSNSTLIAQSRTFVDQLDKVVGDARVSLQSTNTLLGGVEDDLVTVKNDLSLFTLASITSLLGVDGDTFDANAIANFIASPTKIRTEKMYENTSYGAAMAPLFMNLTFWIGAFMFLVVFRNVADDEGVANLTPKQRYLSRFLYFCVPAMLQGIICCIGLAVMGVSIVSLPAMMLAAVVCSLAYLSIIYALSLMFMHVGKGLCIFLVFLQIPSATGLYPIQMTEPFYEAICPLFPFTYGIAAIREALSGFYGTYYWECLGVLAIFFLLFLIIGVSCQPLLANVNRTTAREVGLSGLLNGDCVELPARKFKAAEVLKRLSNHESYRIAVADRFERFSRLYPRLIRTGLGLMVAIPLVTGIIGGVLQVDRAVTLTVWTMAFVAALVYFIGLETFKNRFAEMFAMVDMSDDQIAEVAVQRNKVQETEGSDALVSESSYDFWKFDTKREYDEWRKANPEWTMTEETIEFDKVDEKGGDGNA